MQAAFDWENAFQWLLIVFIGMAMVLSMIGLICITRFGFEEWKVLASGGSPTTHPMIHCIHVITFSPIYVMAAVIYVSEVSKFLSS